MATAIEVTFEAALALAKQYKDDGVISTNAKALIKLAEVFMAARKPMTSNLHLWIRATPGWYVKDYADGWVYFDTEEDARKESVNMGGAAIREVKDRTYTNDV